VPRLLSLLVIAGMVTVGQLVLSQLTHCITLLTLVHQNIYNILTLIVSVLTQWKSEETLKNTFGWRRMEVVGSISSLIFLFSLCFATAIEALQTLFHSDHLHTLHHPDWVMIVTGVNVILWIISFSTIGGFSYHQKLAVRQQSGTRGSLSSKSRTQETDGQLSCAYFCQRARVSDLLRDFCGSFFTLLTSSLVYFKVVTEDYLEYLDPIICLVYIIFLISSCISLVKDSCLILLQTIPGNVDISNLKKYLLKKFPGILALHEFHTWTFTPGTLVLTGHIMYQDKSVYTDINRQVETFLYSQGFSKVTIQPEFPHSPNPSVEDITSCALKCKHAECAELTCCKLEDTVSLN